MDKLEQWKKELEKISPWPWKHEDDSVSDLTEDVDVLHENVKHNLAFIARSPARIAALIKVAEAAEVKYESYKHQAVWNREEANLAEALAALEEVE